VTLRFGALCYWCLRLTAMTLEVAKGLHRSVVFQGADDYEGPGVTFCLTS
jgi:hypothetical protein